MGSFREFTIVHTAEMISHTSPHEAFVELGFLNLNPFVKGAFSSTNIKLRLPSIYGRLFRHQSNRTRNVMKLSKRYRAMVINASIFQLVKAPLPEQPEVLIRGAYYGIFPISLSLFLR